VIEANGRRLTLSSHQFRKGDAGFFGDRAIVIVGVSPTWIYFKWVEPIDQNERSHPFEKCKAAHDRVLANPSVGPFRITKGE
jgi:hypothetical protein